MEVILLRWTRANPFPLPQCGRGINMCPCSAQPSPALPCPTQTDK